MQNIASYFIRRPRIANLILFLIVLVGILSAFNLRRQGYPAINFDIMKITTEYPGASPEDVEVNVTDPIEDELTQVEDIDEIKSMSMENLSMIFVYIDPDATDKKRVRSDIHDAVDRVSDLPSQVTEKPLVEEIRTTNTPVIEVALTGDVSEKELRAYAKALENDLKDVPGVGIIDKVGYNKSEIKIQADQAKIEDRYVSINEIMNAIRSRNVRITGGSLDSYVSEKKIVTFSEYEDPMDVSDVIIRSTFTGKQVRISDVAEVKEGFEEPVILPRANGRRSISLIIMSQERADIITLADGIKKRLERYRESLPANVSATLMYDNSIYTRSLLRMVTSNAIMGFALVLIVMFLFLDWKTAFWTAFGLPIAICGALILFEPFDITINMVTLSAMVLVLGMLVDDAIVIAEKIYQFKEEGMENIQATLAGLKSVFWPVVAAVLTTVLAFMPMLFMTGITGKFIVGIPIVVVLMLGFSLLESTIFLPCHVAHITPPKQAGKRARYIAVARAWYKRRVFWCLANRKKVLGVYMLIFIGVCVAASVWLKFILFPQYDPDIYNVVIEAPRGMPLYETEKKVAEVEAILDEVVPQDIMDSYVTRIGHHDTDVYGGSSGQYSNWALITIYLKPADERAEPSEDLAAELDARFAGIKGLDRVTIQPKDDGPPVGKPVTVIYTSDDDDLRAKFEKDTLAFLKNIDGVSDIETSNVTGKDELRLMLDYSQMAKLGITAMDVSQTVRAAFEGEVVTSIRKGGEEIDFRVSLLEPKAYRAEGVLDLSIANKSGKLVPLGTFAKFDETAGPSVIHHYDANRSVTITAEVDTKIITSGEASRLVVAKFEPQARKHAGFKMEIGGEEKKTAESMESFFFALVVALIAIYFLLVILFDSYVAPLLIMTAIPFSLIGVFITFMVHGLPLGFIAMIGILGLVGVVVNDAIVMVSHLSGVCPSGATLESIAKGAADRFRPIVLTTLTTTAGLMPIAYGIGGDLPFIRPMVLALAWGLVFATVISLIFIPLIFSYHARARATST